MIKKLIMNRRSATALITATGLTCLTQFSISQDTTNVLDPPIDDGSKVTAPEYHLATTDSTAPPTGHSFPAVSSELPYDVDMTPPGNSLFQTQQLFDIFSWQTFIALNWPAQVTKANWGKPQAVALGAAPTAPRVWETYIEPSLIFKSDGTKPEPYNPWKSSKSKPSKKQLSSIGKRTHVLDEVDESPLPQSTNPLPPIIDLNKEYVRFEIRINEPEYKYITGNTLYTIDGQESYITAGNNIRFPLNDGTSKHGAIEIKAAWKKMGDGDDTSKFYTQKVDVYEPFAPGKPTVPDQLYGLVGMHIMARVGNAPEWVWATFEHVDNAPDSNLVTENKLPTSGKKYSFYDPSYDPSGLQSRGGFDPAAYPKESATVSGDYYQLKADRKPTQIARVITMNNDIITSKWTTALNTKMQTELADTVWKNYRLVSTQWPSQTGKGAAGNPAPIALGNAVLETYMQVNANCMSCHAYAKCGNDQSRYANFSFMLQRAAQSTTTSK